MVTMLGCIFVQQNNMSDKNSTNSFETGLPTLLFIVFLVLKLTGNIDWSWWWVTSPLWLPGVLVIIFIIIVMILNKGDI
jgi:hypothetical protein